MIRLRIGYVPLTDAAVLIAAAELGFAESENIELDLDREVSWANIRDKLIFGAFDAAHILAPAAIATSLGLGHVRLPLSVPFALNLNGNAITLGSALFDELASAWGHAPQDARETAQALALCVAARRRAGMDPLKFGVVFPFSSHTYLLRHWLLSASIDPDRDVELIVVPPPYMVQGLREGLLHGFCVGSPWNSLAVGGGAGRIVALGVEIAGNAPEKVLALRSSFAEDNSEIVQCLVRALHKAAEWCAARENHGDLAELLSDARHLDLPAALIRDTLDGNLRVSPDRKRSHPDFLILGGNAINRPDVRHAMWLYAEMIYARQTDFSPWEAAKAASVYRPDIYDAAVKTAAPAFLPEDPIGLAQGPSLANCPPHNYFRVLSDHFSVN